MLSTEKEQSWPAILDGIYSEYRHFMLRIAGSYIDDPQACEDVFHNAFLALIRNQERVMQLTAPQLKAYLLLAVRHASIDYLRKERRMNLVDIADGMLEELVCQPGESVSASERSFRALSFTRLCASFPRRTKRCCWAIMWWAWIPMSWHSFWIAVPEV